MSTSGPTLDGKDLLIRMMSTPNPYALKFVINASFKDDGKATFNSPAECETLPLARDLFSIPGVKQIHFFQNTLTVTHSGDLPDDRLAEQVEAILRSRYAVHDPKFGGEAGGGAGAGAGGAGAAKTARAAPTDPVIQQIEEILDRTVRPGLQADGGDIEVLGLENDELRILYQGACGGCPSSMSGTLDAIQGILRNELGMEKLLVVPVAV